MNTTQRGYHAAKRELLAMLMAVKKLHHLVFGRRVVLWSDSVAACGMVNNPSSAPDATLLRWVTVVRGFVEAAKHVSRNNNPIADALSRMETIVPGQERHVIMDDAELECFVDEKLERFALSAVVDDEVLQEAEEYIVITGRLYRRELGALPRLVLDSPTQQALAISRVHSELGHRGFGATFSALRSRYFWRSLRKD
uniref:RNA-directed DNA polymerase n=1 Tax=Romanomermis culicivorax TaxID=13658 RepID=A0A915I146_ROMCU